MDYERSIKHAYIVLGVISLIIILGSLNISGMAVSKSHTGSCITFEKFCTSIDDMNRCNQCCALEHSCLIESGMRPNVKMLQLCMDGCSKIKPESSETIGGCLMESGCTTSRCCKGYEGIGCVAIECLIGEHVCTPDCI